MPHGKTAILHSYHYSLEPGDVTRYTFSFCPLLVDSDPEKAEAIYPGATSGAFQLVIMMASSSACGLVPYMDTDRDGLVGYMRGHGFQHADEYTLRIILAAMDVLIHRPLDIEGAMEAMKQFYEGEWAER